MMERLPRDALNLIFRQAEAEDVARCRAVCPSWNQFLQSSEFGDIWRYSKQETRIYYKIRSPDGTVQNRCWKPDSGIVTHQKLPLPKNWRSLSAMKGMVLAMGQENDGERNLYFGNPLVGQWQMLPRLLLKGIDAATMSKVTSSGKPTKSLKMLYGGEIRLLPDYTIAAGLTHFWLNKEGKWCSFDHRKGNIDMEIKDVLVDHGSDVELESEDEDGDELMTEAEINWPLMAKFEEERIALLAEIQEDINDPFRRKASCDVAQYFSFDVRNLGSFVIAVLTDDDNRATTGLELYKEVVQEEYWQLLTKITMEECFKERAHVFSGKIKGRYTMRWTMRYLYGHTMVFVWPMSSPGGVVPVVGVNCKTLKWVVPNEQISTEDHVVEDICIWTPHLFNKDVV